MRLETVFSSVVGFFCILPALPAMADPTLDARCEWADCGRGSDDKPSENLPPCTQNDEFVCKDECRREFGPDFHLCVKKCLKGSCIAEAAEKKDDPAFRDDQAGCVELESEECDTECRLDTEASKARCRRRCIEQRCPKANRLDIAKESGSPGTLKCDRCKKEVEQFCNQSCAVSSGMGRINPGAGLANLGCVKVCVASSCTQSCGARMPW
jgi:hypothetical protein